MSKKSKNKLRQLINQKILQKMSENNTEIIPEGNDKAGTETVTVDNTEPVTTNVTEAANNGDTPPETIEPNATGGNEAAAPAVVDPLSLVEQSSEKPAAVVTAESIIQEASNGPVIHPHVAAVIQGKKAEAPDAPGAPPETSDPISEEKPGDTNVETAAAETVETTDEVQEETTMSFNPWVVLLLVVLLIIIVYGIYRFSRK